MPLMKIDLPLGSDPLPGKAIEILREAERRIEAYVDCHPVLPTGFVPSNFETVFRALTVISERSLACGGTMCEWGSGFGVVASLAVVAGYRAFGIEIEAELVAAARELAEDFDLTVEFAQGSFIPEEAQADAEMGYLENQGQPSWLVTHAESAYEELGLEPDDFDVIFAYPWPGEESVIERLFERTAGVGALLLLFDQFNTVTLKRKVAGKRRRS